MESLKAFLEDMCDTLPVDKDRVYLTGLSMGGTGTFLFAMANPDKFAAIAPICGSGIVWYAEALQNIPVYMYHGDCDDIVPISESVTMLTKINKRGGNAQLKILYGVGHNAWDYAYEGDELVNWLLSHSKK
jgi:predicted peptidase